MEHLVATSFNPSSLSSHDMTPFAFAVLVFEPEEGGGGWGGGMVIPYKRLMGMCRWLGSHFYDWIDYNGVGHFRIFWGKTVLYIYG